VCKIISRITVDMLLGWLIVFVCREEISLSGYRPIPMSGVPDNNGRRAEILISLEGVDSTISQTSSRLDHDRKDFCKLLLTYDECGCRMCESEVIRKRRLRC